MMLICMWCRGQSELRSALEEYQRAGVLVRKLVISGHGSAKSTGDLTSKSVAALLREYAGVIAPNAEIVLMGCSNGAGGEGADNMVNATADAAPHAHARGAREPFEGTGFEVEDDRLEGGIEWSVPEYERKAKDTPK